MFRLINYKCVNSEGFRSGLGVKTVALNLSSKDFMNKNVFVISGRNGSGKSVLAESLHPFTNNTGVGRQKFFTANKEGIIIRDYRDDDGTEIYTKIVYSPRSTGGHNSKCYFAIKKVSDSEPIELNPTGNVTSYNALIKTYFNITKEYISFASYSEAVKGLVTETSYDRKNKISALIPNTDRFEIAYQTINDKYRGTRMLAKNIAQKLAKLRDVDSVKGELNRIEKNILESMEIREDAVKSISSLSAKIETISKGLSVEELMKKYNEMHNDMLQINYTLTDSYSKLINICDTCNINDTPEEITKYIERCKRAEISLPKYIAARDSASESISSHLTQISKLENDISELESTLFSIQTQSLDDLKDNLKVLKARISGMEYTNHVDEYKDMSYDEAMTLMNIIDTLKSMSDHYHDKYGEIYSTYLKSGELKYDHLTINNLLNSTDKEISDSKYTLQSIQMEINELYHYSKLKDTLSNRPNECNIDTCPFIKEALKWPMIEKQIYDLKEKYSEEEKHWTQLNDKYHELSLHRDFMVEIRSILTLIEKHSELFYKYLNIDDNDIFAELAVPTKTNIFNLDKLKSIAAILSEKNLYIKITTVDIPEVESNIKLAKDVNHSRDMVQNSIDKLNASIQASRDEISNLKRTKYATEMQISHLDNLSHVGIELERLWKNVTENDNMINKLKDEYDTLGETVKNIIQMVDKIKEYRHEIKKQESILNELNPRREILKYNLNEINQLNVDKCKVDRDFLILDMMRMIIAPGKGLWGECISLYMDDIRDTANQLLLSMFNGNLCLGEFVITDKEFLIPYIHNGTEAEDVSMASSSQQAAISMALSMAIIAKLNGNYGVCVFDEADAPMSPENKDMFAETLIQQAKFIGINQIFVVTHSPYIYSGYNVCRINFPDAEEFPDDINVDILEKSN